MIEIYKTHVIVESSRCLKKFLIFYLKCYFIITLKYMIKTKFNNKLDILKKITLSNNYLK